MHGRARRASSLVYAPNRRSRLGASERLARISVAAPCPPCLRPRPCAHHVSNVQYSLPLTPVGHWGGYLLYLGDGFLIYVIGVFTREQPKSAKLGIVFLFIR